MADQDYPPPEMVTLLNKGLEAVAMTQEKSTDTGIEVVTSETLQSLSLFGQGTNSIESIAYSEHEIDEPIENFELEGKELGSEEEEEIEAKWLLHPHPELFI